MNKMLKICGWGALGIVLLFALVLAVASPLAKHIINNRGEDIIGRHMHAERVIINPFWGGVSVNGFQCKEANGETDFVAFERLYVQIAWPQLACKRVKIRAIRLDNFNGQVLKNKDKLNFSDIIDSFVTHDSVPEDTVPSKWTVALDDIRINNSSVRYRDVLSGKQWKVEDVSLRIPGLYFDNTQTNAGLEFGLPTGGRVGIIAGMKLQSNRYALQLNLQDVHSDVVLPLVQDYLNVSGLGAKVNGTVHVDGSLDVLTNVRLSGRLSMTGLSIRDTHDTQVAAMDELRAVISRGELNTRTFILDTLAIEGITGDYEVHESWNTLSRLLKQNEQLPDTSATVKAVKTEPSKSIVWMSKKVTVTGHDLCYHDYSMKNDWEYAVKTLRIEGSNIATNGRNSLKIKATLTSDAQLTADFTGGLDLAKQDTRLALKLKGVQLEDFSPLCRNYTAYPLESGVLAAESNIQVTSGKLSGNNRIEIDHPRVGKKEHLSRAPYKNLPVRLGAKMLTSSQDLILLDVPVSGDANNPKFSFRKVIGRALLKVFFGPLMGMNDRDKSLSKRELEEMQELLNDSTESTESTETTESAEPEEPTDSVGRDVFR